MFIEGQEVVTRPTAIAAKTLLISGITISAIELYDVPIRDLEILNVALPAGLYRAAVGAILGYGVYNLALRLWLDAFVYFRWFEAADSYIPLNDGGSIRTIRHQLSKLEDILGTHHVENLRPGKVDDLIKWFRRTKRSFSILSWSARYFLIVHHGLIPLAAAFTAAWLVFVPC